MSRFIFPAVTALVGAVAAAQPPTTGNAANRKPLYEKVGCYECHGYAAQGGSDARALPPRR